MTESHKPPEQRYQETLDRVEITKRRFARFTALMAALTLLAVLVSGWVGRQQIVDCTHPGGECYDQSAKRSAEVIGDLNADHEEIVNELHELNRLVRSLREELRDVRGNQDPQG